MNTVSTIQTERSPTSKDSMKSTWRTQDRDTWSTYHWLIDRLNAHHIDLDQPVPVRPKSDKIPYMPQWSHILWVSCYSFLTLAVHQIWLECTGFQNLSSVALFTFYFMAFNLIMLHEIHILRRLGHRYGFLDGDEHQRDGVPDSGVKRVALSLFKTVGSRIAASIFLTFDPAEAPKHALMSWKWWAFLVVKIGMYALVLDFWFYWYHRAMHDVPFLWKYHRRHHLTKHPNPLLTAYADEEQEFFDMVGVPLMTYFTMRAIRLPLGFYDWWICHLFIAYTEIYGHSGLRVHMSPPSTMNWLLQIFHVELVIEDHDLHHRRGWRKSHNYGKQTRVWDTLFGTCTGRVESAKGNIDYRTREHMPLF